MCDVIVKPFVHFQRNIIVAKKLTLALNCMKSENETDCNNMVEWSIFTAVLLNFLWTTINLCAT